MHMPAAAEALAEAALLDECARHLCVPDQQSCFSYWPVTGTSAKGYFESYMVGLKARQRAVSQAIAACDNDVVARYVDIKAFYPTLRIDVARKAWERYCDECAISAEMVKLGHAILDRHHAAGDGKSILTGPMFSHFIGDFGAQRDLTLLFTEGLIPKVFRYVDDYILVGSVQDVAHGVHLLTERLGELGLNVHPEESDKSIQLSGAAWLSSERDFESGEISRNWMKLVGDIKKLLLFNIDQVDSMLDELRALEFRLPVRAYEAAVKEASTFEKIRQVGLWGWLYSKMRRLYRRGS